MLGPLLVASLLVLGAQQGSERKPILPPGARERSLSLRDLLAEVPDDAWDRWPSRWTSSPATLELRRRAESGELTDEEWSLALVQADTIHTRKKWPAGQPLMLSVDEQAWLRMTEIRVHAVEPELGEVFASNLLPSWCGNGYIAEKENNSHLRLAPLPDGTTQIVFEVTILQANDLENGSLESHRLWKGRIRLPVRATSTLEEALPSTTIGTEEIEHRLVAGRSSFCPSKGDLYVSLRGTSAEFPALEHTGIALIVEVWRSGQRVGATGFSGFGAIRIFSGLAGSIGPGADLSTWELRVRSDPARALAMWYADRCWSGEFTLPLSVAMARAKD